MLTPKVCIGSHRNVVILAVNVIALFYLNLYRRMLMPLPNCPRKLGVKTVLYTRSNRRAGQLINRSHVP